MFKLTNKDTRTTSMTCFTPFSSVSVIDLEQINVCWLGQLFRKGAGWGSVILLQKTSSLLLFLKSLKLLNFNVSRKSLIRTIFVKISWKIPIYVQFALTEYQLFFCFYLTSRYLLVQRQQCKHQKNVWTMFKINNKETKPRHSVILMIFWLNVSRFHTMSWCLHCLLWTTKCWLRNAPLMCCVSADTGVKECLMVFMVEWFSIFLKSLRY